PAGGRARPRGWGAPGGGADAKELPGGELHLELVARLESQLQGTPGRDHLCFCELIVARHVCLPSSASGCPDPLGGKGERVLLARRTYPAPCCATRVVRPHGLAPAASRRELRSQASAQVCADPVSRSHTRESPIAAAPRSGVGGANATRHVGQAHVQSRVPRRSHETFAPSSLSP